MSEVWTDYLTLVANPDASTEDDRAFWDTLELEFSMAAVADVRRAIAWFLAEYDEPPPQEVDVELLDLWKR